MRRNSRRVFNEENETKKMIFISLSVLIIAILAFVVTFAIYSSYLNSSDDMGQTRITPITDLASTSSNTIDDNTAKVSADIGKSVNEIIEENEKSNTEVVNKIAINTSNMIKENISDNTNRDEQLNVTEEKKVEKTNTNKEEKVPNPTFIKPVEGEITVNFAKDTLVYSNTLQEWVTHTGIDIKADKTTIVKASAEGTVKSIKNDPRFGITVVIEHVNGFSSVYSNLLTAEFVKEGEKVKQGQTIGTVGNTARFEIADEPHLHFEILKNSEQIDPSLYIK